MSPLASWAIMLAVIILGVVLAFVIAALDKRLD